MRLRRLRDDSGVERDYKKALAIFAASCPSVPYACDNLGALYAKGVQLLVRACADDVGVACHELGESKRDALHGAPTNLPGALADFTHACEQGVAEGCNAAGWMLFKGNGVTQDTPRALSLARATSTTKRVGSARSAGARGSRGSRTILSAVLPSWPCKPISIT